MKEKTVKVSSIHNGQKRNVQFVIYNLINDDKDETNCVSSFFYELTCLNRLSKLNISYESDLFMDASHQFMFKNVYNIGRENDAKKMVERSGRLSSLSKKF